jgi:galactokinase
LPIFMSHNNLDQFEQVFGSSASLLAQAPGRLEVLGNHTDYNEGFVLSIAVDRGTQIYFKKIEGNSCQVFSPAMGDGIREFDITDISTPLPNKDWTNYVRGVLVELQKRGHTITAFQALITSDIPLSAGMSSSASLEMAIVTGLDALFDLKLELKEKALIGQGCENNYIGANTGLMDQLTSLSGVKGEMVVSEYRDVTVSHTPLPEDLAFVVINSNVAHDLSQEYNERRQQCESAVATIAKDRPEIKALRDVDLHLLEDSKNKLDLLDYKRALHVVGENARVQQAKEFLNSHGFTQFGQLLFESHASSKSNFENSCPELDALVEIAQQSPLCLGARLSGGGFGGISIHLVSAIDAEQYCSQATEAYTKTTGKQTTAFICRSADGASAQTL